MQNTIDVLSANLGHFFTLLIPLHLDVIYGSPLTGQVCASESESQVSPHQRLTDSLTGCPCLMFSFDKRRIGRTEWEIELELSLESTKES